MSAWRIMVFLRVENRDLILIIQYTFNLKKFKGVESSELFNHTKNNVLCYIISPKLPVSDP